jgi:hypothetical protein
MKVITSVADFVKLCLFMKLWMKQVVCRIAAELDFFLRVETPLHRYRPSEANFVVWNSLFLVYVVTVERWRQRKILTSSSKFLLHW